MRCSLAEKGKTMAKKTRRKSHGIMHSDIPYKDRLMVNKFANIAEHRDHAALTAMKIATVALNDTEGLGYLRLSRFAKHQHELTEEYYSDPEYMEEKLNQRLTQIGFLIENGRIYCAEDDNGNIVSTKTLGSDCNDKS